MLCAILGGFDGGKLPPVHGRVNIVSVKMMEGCCLHFLATDDREAEGVVRMWASEVA